MTDPITTGVINEVFRHNLDVITQNFGQIQGTSSRLVLGLATIEFLLFLYGAYKARSEEVIARAIEKLFLIFVVALLTFNWGAVAGWMRGYIGGGGAGIGGGNAMITSMNPAHVATDGLDKVMVIFSPEGQRTMMEGSFFDYSGSTMRERKRRGEDEEKEEDDFFAQVTGLESQAVLDGLTDAGTEIGMMIVVAFIFCGLALLIVFTHFYVALQLFVLTIDWYLTVAFTQLLIPFAVNKHTSPLASAGFQAVVRKSVQLGVMMAVLGIFGNTIQGLGLGPQPTMVDVLSLLLGSLTLAFMVKNIPQIASSIFAGGGGTVDVGGALQAAAASVAQRATNAMSGGTSMAAGVVARGAGMAAGAGFEAGRKGAQLAGQGASRVGRAGLEGAAFLGSRAKDVLDAAKGGRDAEPKSLEDLHEMQLEESSRVSNQVEQNSLGSMQVDSTGNVQNASPSSSGPDSARTEQEDGSKGAPRQAPSDPASSSSGESASSPSSTSFSRDAQTSSSTSPSPATQDDDDKE